MQSKCQMKKYSESLTNIQKDQIKIICRIIIKDINRNKSLVERQKSILILMLLYVFMADLNRRNKQQNQIGSQGNLQNKEMLKLCQALIQKYKQIIQVLKKSNSIKDPQIKLLQQLQELQNELQKNPTNNLIKQITKMLIKYVQDNFINFSALYKFQVHLTKEYSSVDQKIKKKHMKKFLIELVRINYLLYYFIKSVSNQNIDNQDLQNIDRYIAMDTQTISDQQIDGFFKCHKNLENFKIKENGSLFGTQIKQNLKEYMKIAEKSKDSLQYQNLWTQIFKLM